MKQLRFIRVFLLMIFKFTKNLLPVINKKQSMSDYFTMIGHYNKCIAKTECIERIYLDDPNIPDWVKKEHIDRYEFALHYMQNGQIVLDAACGSGYGSRILSQKAKKVVGVDISSDAINYAQKYNFKNNIEYQIVDLNQPLKFQNEHFDVIISFETLEHLQNREGFLNELKRILKPGGILIISAPDWNITNKTTVIQNPYHIKEPTKEEFVELILRFFKIERLFGQTEYLPSRRWKKLIKLLIIKLDFLKLREIIFKEKMKNKLIKHLSSTISTPIQEIDINSPSKYQFLIAVARKL